MRLATYIILLSFYATESYAITLAEIAEALEKQEPSILNTTIVPRGKSSQLSHWQQAFQNWEAEQQQFSNCLDSINSCESYQWTWRHMMHAIAGKQPKEQLAAVQSFFNNWHYKADAVEYWAAPTMAFEKAVGDCEDIAIAKYSTLSLLGFSEDDMKVVAVRDKINGKMHAVLAVNNTLLDNSGAPMYHTTRYQPRYSFNRFQKWLHL